MSEIKLEEVKLCQDVMEQDPTDWEPEPEEDLADACEPWDIVICLMGSVAGSNVFRWMFLPWMKRA